MRYTQAGVHDIFIVRIFIHRYLFLKVSAFNSSQRIPPAVVARQLQADEVSRIRIVCFCFKKPCNPQGNLRWVLSGIVSLVAHSLYNIKIIFTEVLFYKFVCITHISKDTNSKCK